MDLLSIPDYYTERATSRAPLRKEAGSQGILHSQPVEEEVQEEGLQGIHDRFVPDEQFRSRMIQIGRTEDLCRQMDGLADEDHTHHLTTQEYYKYISNWWLRSNKIGSDTMPIRRRSDFKQALSTLRQLKEKEEEAQQKTTMDTKLLFVLVELARIMVDSLSYESHHGDVPDKKVIGTLLQGMIFPN